MANGYTAGAGRVIRLAAEIAAQYGQGYVGTEHILIGMLRDGGSVAGRILAAQGVTVEAVEQMVKDLIAPDTPVVTKGKDGFSPRAQKVLGYAAEEAIHFNEEKIGTEHLLLAILADQDSCAARIINTLNVNLQKVCVRFWQIWAYLRTRSGRNWNFGDWSACVAESELLHWRLTAAT